MENLNISVYISLKALAFLFSGRSGITNPVVNIVLLLTYMCCDPKFKLNLAELDLVFCLHCSSNHAFFCFLVSVHERKRRGQSVTSSNCFMMSLIMRDSMKEIALQFSAYLVALKFCNFTYYTYHTCQPLESGNVLRALSVSK